MLLSSTADSACGTSQTTNGAPIINVVAATKMTFKTLGIITILYDRQSREFALDANLQRHVS